MKNGVLIRSILYRNIYEKIINENKKMYCKDSEIIEVYIYWFNFNYLNIEFLMKFFIFLIKLFFYIYLYKWSSFIFRVYIILLCIKEFYIFNINILGVILLCIKEFFIFDINIWIK